MNSHLYLVIFLLLIGSCTSNKKDQYRDPARSFNTSDYLIVKSSGKLCSLNICKYKFNLGFTTDKVLRDKFKSMVLAIESKKLFETSEIHKQIFGSSKSGIDYLSWISKRVKRISQSSPEEEPKFYALVPREYFPETVMFTSKVHDDDINDMFLFSILAHESMHAGRGSSGNGHTYCKKSNGRYESSDFGVEGSKPKCDNDYDKSFGTTYTIMCNIVNYCTNCNDFEIVTAKNVALKSIERVARVDSVNSLVNDCDLSSK